MHRSFRRGLLAYDTKKIIWSTELNIFNASYSMYLLFQDLNYNDNVLHAWKKTISCYYIAKNKHSKLEHVSNFCSLATKIWLYSTSNNTRNWLGFSVSTVDNSMDSMKCAEMRLTALLNCADGIRRTTLKLTVQRISVQFGAIYGISVH